MLEDFSVHVVCVSFNKISHAHVAVDVDILHIVCIREVFIPLRHLASTVSAYHDFCCYSSGRVKGVGYRMVPVMVIVVDHFGSIRLPVERGIHHPSGSGSFPVYKPVSIPMCIGYGGVVPVVYYISVIVIRVDKESAFKVA